MLCLSRQKRGKIFETLPARFIYCISFWVDEYSQLWVFDRAESHRHIQTKVNITFILMVSYSRFIVGHKMQWPQEDLNYEQLNYELFT